MEIENQYFNKDEYVETVRILRSAPETIDFLNHYDYNLFPFDQTTGNKVSRHTVLCGSQNIILHGKVIVQTGAIIRGDLANVKTGRYCVINKRAVIRPPYKQFSSGLAFFPLYIGDHVFVGEGSIISAASIGSYVYIGRNVVIGRRCTLKDCCIIEDGAVVPPDTTVASFMRFTADGQIEGGQGNLTFVPSAMQEQMTEFTKSYYEHFVPEGVE